MGYNYVKVLDNDERVVYVNQNLVTDFSYIKQDDKTIIAFCGDQDNYSIIPGDVTFLLRYGYEETEANGNE